MSWPKTDQRSGGVSAPKLVLEPEALVAVFALLRPGTAWGDETLRLGNEGRRRMAARPKEPTNLSLMVPVRFFIRFSSEVLCSSRRFRSSLEP